MSEEIKEHPADYSVTPDNPCGTPDELVAIGLDPAEWRTCARKSEGILGCNYHHLRPPSPDDPIGGCQFRKDMGKGPVYKVMEHSHPGRPKKLQILPCWHWMQYFSLRMREGHRIVASEGDVIEVKERVPKYPDHPTNKEMVTNTVKYRVPSFPRPAVSLAGVAEAVEGQQESGAQESEMMITGPKRERRGPPVADAKAPPIAG